MRRAANICLASLLCAFLLMPTGWAHSAEVKYEEGIEFSRRGDYKGAIVAFTQCIESLPNEASGYGCFAHRGTAKNNLGLYDDAIVDANEAIKRYMADYAYGYYVRGYAYMAKKEYDKAIEDLRKSLSEAQKLEKNLLPSIYRELGRAYYGKADYEQAVSNFQTALELDVKFASAYWWLGNAYEKSGNQVKALNAYENYIQYANPKGSYVETAKMRIEKLSKP